MGSSGLRWSLQEAMQRSVHALRADSGCPAWGILDQHLCHFFRLPPESPKK